LTVKQLNEINLIIFSDKQDIVTASFYPVPVNDKSLDHTDSLSYQLVFVPGSDKINKYGFSYNLIKMKCLLYLFFFFGDILISNNITFGVGTVVVLIV
jgi:hypothetical protein